MDLHIDLTGRRGHRDEIYRQIREAVLDGRLRDGDALPPTRELAQRLTVSRTTVSAAYERLAAEGFLNARAGAGTFVRSGAAPRPTVAAAEPEDGVRPRPEWTAVPPAPRSFGPVAEYDFRSGVPDVRLFPFDTWRRLMSQRLRGSQAELLMYGSPQGDPRLRAGLARHLGVSRNVRVRPEDIVVTTGVQQTVDLVARVLLRPGDRVAVEDPGYPPPRLLMGTLGLRVEGVPVDDEGIVVEQIPAGTRLVYVTPSHQCPLGVAMSLARRRELLDWAERTGAVIVEDDYDSEFRYTGRPLEPLHSLDSRGRVVYVGSMSKVLSPALRVGFLAAPPSLVGALAKAKYLADWHTPALEQAVLADFIDEGGFARHIRRMRKIYRERHDLLVDGLRREFGDVLNPVPAAAGLHLGATADRDLRGVARSAREAGVRLLSLGDFSVTRPSHGLLFGYGAIAADRIEPGLRRLRRVFDEGVR
ncbi:PLP-dependent aminotransferase family protein [Amycolatopsis rhabdoformis]|uniref:PLP-dependent aminotransferase family protein n=1 Tax=Amycolatopsis rhabdoformis TaxID=1448059 RepID=A0ABZ1I8I8_9PSEU|nr:PLP-dependent aminotransferase family protein [Amycolatopsis rhabdoformis]WSE30750.1 PLP-dependent aminotransferase family protein [Amycolatopsis rhabdoformis]